MNEGAAIYTTSIAPVSGAIAAADENSQKTASPIKHLLVLIDENSASDNVHSTYVPTSGQKVWNLLSTDRPLRRLAGSGANYGQSAFPATLQHRSLSRRLASLLLPSRESVWRNLLGRFGCLLS